MRVVEYERFGGPDVLVVRDRADPKPGPGRVLIRVHAAALNPKDIIVQSGRHALHRLIGGTRFPKRLGYDWSGECIAVGADVTAVRPGDALYGMIDAWAGGACATHLVAVAGELAGKPEALSWADAAAVPLAALTALQALRDLAGVGPGHRVLVNGASGGVGTFAVQVAKALGATVTAVTSGKNEALVRSLGADVAIDYTDAADIRTSAGTHDVFFDVFGNRSFGWAAPVLSDGGIYVSTVPKAHVLRDTLLTLTRRKRARLVRVASRRSDLLVLGRWIEKGVIRPVVDRVFALDDVADAERYLATRHARGKVVISVA